MQRSEHEELIQAHRVWMETAEAKAVYRLWGQTIEIVFADVKEHRGLRRFSGHGLVRVRTAFALEVLRHNLLVLHRFLRRFPKIIIPYGAGCWHSIKTERKARSNAMQLK